MNTSKNNNPRKVNAEDIERLRKHYSDAEYRSAIDLCQKFLRQNNSEDFILEVLGASLLNISHFNEAVKVFKIGLKNKPKNLTFINGLALAYKNLGDEEKSIELFELSLSINDTDIDALNNLGNLFTKRDDLDKAVWFLRKALDIEPKNINLLNNLGIALMGMKNFDDAAFYFKQALSGSPKFYQCKLNLAHAYRLSGNSKLAIELFKQLCLSDPSDVNIKFYLGLAQLNAGCYDDCIIIFLNYLEHNPESLEALTNLGVAHYKIGEIEKALHWYMAAMRLNSEFILPYEYFLEIKTQLKDNHLIDVYLADLALREKLSSEAESLQILAYHLIDAFQENNQVMTYSLLLEAQKCQLELSKEGKHKQRFFVAYTNFISALSKEPSTVNIDADTKIYHLGDSHCLTFANRFIENGQEMAIIYPKITFGAKAYHFTTSENNQFKSMTKLNFDSIPMASKVLISFGEIDCRSDEGIITAVNAVDNLLKVVEKTVLRYVQWFDSLNLAAGHDLYFMNIPAPMIIKDITYERNQAVAEIVKLFNITLTQCTKSFGNQVLDVYSHTVDKNGFSNKKFHVDQRHLSPRILNLLKI